MNDRRLCSRSERALREIDAADADPVAAELIPLALTAGNFVYDNGATQVFEADGAMIERGEIRIA